MHVLSLVSLNGNRIAGSTLPAASRRAMAFHTGRSTIEPMIGGKEYQGRRPLETQSREPNLLADAEVIFTDARSC